MSKKAVVKIGADVKEAKDEKVQEDLEEFNELFSHK